MRIWLHHLYIDMQKIPATQFSIDPGYWHEMVFRSRPPGTAIPIGGKLVEVRHRKLITLEDVRSSLLSERRVWLRIRDPTSTRRLFGLESIRTLQILSTWMKRTAPIRSIWPLLHYNFMLPQMHAHMVKWLKSEDSSTSLNIRFGFQNDSLQLVFINWK